MHTETDRIRRTHLALLQSRYARFFSTLQHLTWRCAYSLNALLLCRFILKFFGADPNTAYTFFVYLTTQPFTTRFIASDYPYGTDTFVVFEWSTLIAIAIYWVTGAGIVLMLAAIQSLMSASRRKKLTRMPKVQLYPRTSYPQAINS